jgi:hypothetical protein
MTATVERPRIGDLVTVRGQRWVVGGVLPDGAITLVNLRGLDDWDYGRVPDGEPIQEPRLLAEIKRTARNRRVEQLRPAPWLDGIDRDPTGPASRVGVPVVPFPAWLRCTACDELAAIETKIFGFQNEQPRRPPAADGYGSSRCGAAPPPTGYRCGRRPRCSPTWSPRPGSNCC